MLLPAPQRMSITLAHPVICSIRPTLEVQLSQSGVGLQRLGEGNGAGSPYFVVCNQALNVCVTIV